MRKITLLGSLFVLLLCPLWAHAALNLMPSPDEPSVIYLSYVFGAVNGVLHGSGSQILGRMFAQFNSAVLALGALVASYTTVMGVLQTMQDGELLGKKFSSVMVPLRTLLGILMIAPTASGYSWIQVVVMWIVLQGIGAADLVWNAVLNYIKSGGLVVQSSRDVRSYGIQNNIQSLISPLFCLNTMGQALLYASLDGANKGLTFPSETPFDSVVDSLNQNSQTVPMPNFNTAPFSVLNGMCGTLSFSGSYQSYVAVYQVLMDLNLPISGVANSVCCTNCTTSTTSSCTQAAPTSSCSVGQAGIPLTVACQAQSSCTYNAGQAALTANTMPSLTWCTVPPTQSVSWSVSNAANDFIGLSATYDNSNNSFASSGSISAGDQSWNISQSWMLAGAFYFDLANVSSAASSGGGQAATLNPVDQTFTNGLPGAINNLSGLGNVPTYLKQWMEPIFTPASGTTLPQQFTALTRAVQNTGTVGTSSSSSIDGNMPSWASMLGFSGFIDVFRAIAAFAQDQENNSNPLIIATVLGNGLISTALTCWGLLIVIFTVGAASLAGIPCSNWGIVPQVIWEALSPLITALLVPMFVTGAILSYYLPFVPYMIFTFGVMGWMIGVIEGMVAAPIVGFGVMNPEGHDLFGQAQTGVNLMLNMFLRPSMMIFGFITGLMMSYIGVWLLNLGFVRVVDFVAVKSAGVNIIIFVIAMPVVYTVIILQIINKSFALIHILPDKVTRWLTGGIQESLGAESAGMEQGARQGFTGVAEGMGKSMGETTGSKMASSNAERSRQRHEAKAAAAAKKNENETGST